MNFLSKIIVLYLTILTVMSGAAPRNADYFVSPQGKDTWSGHKPVANKLHTDGPFATLDRAIQAARLARKPNASPVILLRGGTYYLKNTVVLTPEDSNLVISAYPGENPILSGGVRLNGFKVNNGRWTVTLPEVTADKWSFAQLFTSNTRRYRPRLPKNGFFFVENEMETTKENAGKGYDRLGFKKGDLSSNWANLHDIEVCIFQNWSMHRFPVKSIDEKESALTTDGTTPGMASYFSMPRGNRYLIDNVKEALAAPGQWYLDRPTGVLTYIPLPGESPTKTVVIAPRLERLVELKGNPGVGAFVSNVTFDGIGFQHANWRPGAQVCGQSEVNLGGAIYAEGAISLQILRCNISHVGQYAVELGAGCRKCRIDSCEITDIGAGGVKIGTQGIMNGAMQAEGNIVRNCLIAHGGRLHPAGCGVWIGQSPGNLISHNEIADFYYTGVSSGWTWGYDINARATGNTLEYCHIHDIGQGVLSDLAAFYSLGLQTGSVVRNNLCHDIASFTYGGWGIYFDEGTSNILAENNVVYNTKTGGFHQHYGKDNHVTNNIFAFAREGQIIRTRQEEHRSFYFDHNIVYWIEGPLLGSNWSEQHYNLDYNLYWNASGRAVTFAGMDFNAWKLTGQDVHSLIADPQFTDPANRVFTLKKDSPAYKLGFKPIDMRDVGPIGKRKAEPLAPRAFPAPPPPLPPAPISDDFESTSAGKKPLNVNVNEEDAVHTIRITDETASSGKHSIKLVDGPGQKNNFDPHMFYSPGFLQGVIVGSFELKLMPGAIMYHEWRNSESPYKVGPSVRFENSSLIVGGKKLMALPIEKWVNIRITAGVGKRANAKWNLEVTPEGESTSAFMDLTCDPGFQSLDWFGFSMDGDKDCILYLDNIKIAPKT